MSFHLFKITLLRFLYGLLELRAKVRRSLRRSEEVVVVGQMRNQEGHWWKVGGVDVESEGEWGESKLTSGFWY